MTPVMPELLSRLTISAIPIALAAWHCAGYHPLAPNRCARHKAGSTEAAGALATNRCAAMTKFHFRLNPAARGFVLLLAIAAGCQNNPWQARREVLLAEKERAVEDEVGAQDREFQRRAQDLDENNRDLHTRLAQSQREVQLLNDEVGLLRQRLGETADLLVQSRTEKSQSEQQLQALQASATRRGGAIISANNSLRGDVPVIRVPGVAVRQDGDVVRLELPSDQLFLPHSASLHQGSFRLLDPVVDAIRRNYPRQRIGVEGHTDSQSGVLLTGTSPHQLTIAQATAVFEQLQTRYQLSPRQLFVLGHGANHPRVSNATAAGQAKNRRVELVIYPESVDDS